MVYRLFGSMMIYEACTKATAFDLDLGLFYTRFRDDVTVHLKACRNDIVRIEEVQNITEEVKSDSSRSKDIY